VTTTVFAQAQPPTGGSAEISAEKRAEAKQHFANGMRKFDVAKFDEAAAEFVAEYEIMGDPGMLYNIAQAYRLGERQEKALFFYKAFQRHILATPKTSAAMKAEVEKRISELTQAISKSKQAATAPPTGTFSSDQNPQNGHETAMAEPVKPPHKQPERQSEKPPEKPPENATAPEPAIVTSAPVTEHKPSQPINQTLLRNAGIAVGALAVGAIGAGIGLSVAAGKDSQNLQTASMQHAAFGPNLQASEHNGKLYDTVSFAMYGVGAAAAATSAVLLYFGLRPQPSAHAQLAPSFGPGHAGLVVTGAF
jgi:hypothetical protein